MKSSNGEQYHVALLFVVFLLPIGIKLIMYLALSSLNIPANNCAILQKGDDLELLPAGQHYITNPNVTLRGRFFACREYAKQ
jgi:hypothetical protein